MGLQLVVVNQVRLISNFLFSIGDILAHVKNMSTVGETQVKI